MVGFAAIRQALRAKERPNSLGCRPELHIRKNSRRAGLALPALINEDMVLVQETRFG